MTIRQLLDLGLEHHRAGNLVEARRVYQAILAQVPDHADALHLLGLIEYQQGNLQSAIARVRSALAARPNFVEALGNLGLMLCSAGQTGEGVAAYRQAIAIDPNSAEAHYNLALTLLEQSQFEQAIPLFQRAISLKPDYREAHHYLGLALAATGDFAGAIAASSRAIAMKPDDFDARFNLAYALRQSGRLDEAIDAYRRAAALAPDRADVWNNLGGALRAGGLKQEATEAFRKAVALKNDFAEALYNLAHCLNEGDAIEESIATYRRAISLKPELPDAHRNLGAALRNYGKVEEAIESYRRGMIANPTDARCHSDLLLTLYCRAGLDAAAILQEHRQFNDLHAERFRAKARPHSIDRSPGRRLRVGYVSSDFHDHVSNRFVTPLLSCHDRQHFEIFCYSSVTRPDDVTETFQGYVEHWRDIAPLNDDDAAELIRQDGIDILVDLGMHTADNRLLIFARKPAPVQATYLAYSGGTSGLRSIDFRLTDPYLDPPGENDPCYTERSIRLPATYWCMAALENSPPVTELPALSNGFITFGCLAAMCKQNESMLAVWCEVLAAVPGSKLLLHAHPGSARQAIVDFVARHGVSADRILFQPRVNMIDYLSVYNRIDIALDTFPYVGGTTTFDALWMGAPLVTRVGAHAMSRSGLSILSNLGLSELAASTPEDCVRIATELAGDLPRLKSFRRILRQRLLDSRLMDSPQFARDVEEAYAQMWKLMT